MDLYQLKSEPACHQPVMLIALESFVDAGNVRASVAETLREQLDFQIVADFDMDLLIDHRSHRPILTINDGVMTNLEWPSIQLLHAIDQLGNHVLLLDGPEPDLVWHQFINEVMTLATKFAVRSIIGIGSFPGPVPHTRPTEVATTTTDSSLARPVAYLPDELEVPSSIHAAIEWSAQDYGIPALGLWAPVPQYAGVQPYPSAAAALLRRISELTDITVDLSELDEAGERAVRRIDAAVAANPQHKQIVDALEKHIESMEASRADDLPSGDDLAAELQRFLDGQE